MAIQPQTQFGLGLRQALHSEAAMSPHCVDFWEIHPENYFYDRRNIDVLLALRAAGVQISVHGVAMNLGGQAPLDQLHLAKFRTLAEQFEAPMVSEHLAWTHDDDVYLNDLLPLPLTHEALLHFCERVDQAQEAIGRPLLIENPSTYLLLGTPDYHEAEFLNEVSRRTGCGLLLDINNIVVSAFNHRWDVHDYLARLDFSKVGEIHMAGHTQEQFAGQILKIDTHDQPVSEDVFELYFEYSELLADIPVLLERDGNIPPMSELLSELAHLKSARRMVCA